MINESWFYGLLCGLLLAIGLREIGACIRNRITNPYRS